MVRAKPEPICILDSLQTHLEYLRRCPSDKVLKLRGTARLQRETMFETLAAHFGQFGTVQTILLTDCMLVKSSNKGCQGGPFKTRLGHMGFVVMDGALSVQTVLLQSPHHVGDGTCVLNVEQFNMKENESKPKQSEPKHDASVAPFVKMRMENKELQDKVAALEKKLTTLTQPEPSPSTQSQLMAEILLREVQQQLAASAAAASGQEFVDPTMLARAWRPAPAWPQVPVAPGMSGFPSPESIAAANMRTLQAVQAVAAYHEGAAQKSVQKVPEHAHSSAGKWAPMPSTAATSLRDILVELQGQNPACVFVVRGISTISSRASDAVELLKTLFSEYGEVVKVLVPHQKIKAHMDSQNAQLQVKSRPDNRGFILMKDPTSVQKIMGVGPAFLVSDVLGQTHRITTEQFQPSMEGSTSTPESSGLHESSSGVFQSKDFARGASNDSTAPPASSGSGNNLFDRSISDESAFQREFTVEGKAHSESSQKASHGNKEE